MISLRTPIFTILFASLLLFATVQVSFASGMVGELEGYAWSSTIGWISMNCSNTNTCIGDSGPGTPVDYSVQVNPDYSVTGHAWSPNIGWIQFGGLSGFPTGGTSVTTTGSPYDISTATFDQLALSVSLQESDPVDILFNNTGTALYVIGYNGDDINEYTLSTPYDIRTATFRRVALSVATQQTGPSAIMFNNNGTTLYVLGMTSSHIHAYNLSTPYDISTAMFTARVLDVSMWFDAPIDMLFNNTGTVLYVMGAFYDEIGQYTLSTPYDISTATVGGWSRALSVAAQDTSPQSMKFNNTGTALYVLGNTGDDINEYTLSTPYDIRTATFRRVALSVATQQPAPSAIMFNNNGTTLYVLGRTGDTIHAYDMPGPTIVTTDPLYPSTTNARLVESPVGSGQYEFTGWIRACAGTISGDCSGMDDRTDGWDGWISLAGPTSDGSEHKIQFINGVVDAASIDRFAWGSGVVGWVDFAASAASAVRIKGVAPIVTILSPLTPQPFGPVVITFDPIGGGDAPDSCTISDGVDTYTVAGPFTNNESFTDLNPAGDTTYTVECQNAAGTGSATVTVTFLYDLTLAVVPTVGTVVAGGDYDRIAFQLRIAGVPASITNIPYTIEFDGSLDSPLSDTFDGSEAVGGVVTINEEFINVPYAATPQNWTVTVDAPTPGEVPEGGGAAEINEVSGTLNLPAPNPTVTIDTESIVRSGTEADVSITVNSLVDYSCRVFGPGLTGTPQATISGSAGIETTRVLQTSALVNSTTIAVECAVVGAPTPYRERASIEVTPVFQEI